LGDGVKPAKICLAVVLAAGFMVAGPTQVAARVSSCLTDAEIEGALGAAVRGRAPTIDTRALPDIPLCSGLTLAQRIQQMRADAFPEEAARAKAQRLAAIAQEQERKVIPPMRVEPSVSASAPTFQELARPRAINRAVRQDVATRRVPARVREEAPRRAASSGYYPSCKAARAAGVTPIRRGSPGYSARLDRDGDGIACE
jgi:hypothetical protein